jgi:hypothetical protein
MPSLQCEEDQMHPSLIKHEEELHVVVALKKSKVSVAVMKRTTYATQPPAKAPAPPHSRAAARPDTRSMSRRHAELPPPPSSDEDAEGDEDPEVGEIAIEVEQPEQSELCFYFTTFLKY